MSHARTFRLTIAYDGTAFHGWQRQPECRTVQGELERALAVALATESMPVQGAGRTDAGVHARGQVVSFRAETRLPARAIAVRAQRELPPDVRIVAASEAGAEFHARHRAIARRYEYRLLDEADVLFDRFAWRPPRRYDGDGLARAATALVGEHDCTSFEAKGSSPAAPVCRIAHAMWRRWERGWLFDVQADHFLYHMVRNLVGTSLQLSRDPDPAGRMAGVLAARDRAAAGATAPPQGLSLEAVYYEGEET
ncbi:MAG: tRNA pseudouridine(38-40) synthase TruA [Candidatus Eisenbacteria bacterium]